MRYEDLRILPDPEPGFIIKGFDRKMNMERTWGFWEKKSDAKNYLDCLKVWGVMEVFEEMTDEDVKKNIYLVRKALAGMITKNLKPMLSKDNLPRSLVILVHRELLRRGPNFSEYLCRVQIRKY